MERNFRIDGGNALVLGARLFDLHNCYDFTSVSVHSTSRVDLCFAPLSQYTAAVESLLLAVEGLSLLELSPGVLLGTARDVDEIGYKNPGDEDLKWLVSESGATRQDHLIFRLGADDHVRVYGLRAELREVRPPAENREKLTT